MKVHCSCGAKYGFDATPEMAQRPVQFVCPACGLDLSDSINNLVRQELAEGPIPAPMPVEAGAFVAGAGEAEAAPRARPALRVRVHRPEISEAEVAVAPAASDPYCPKHPEQLTTHQCYICRKPICPKCMELTGYVCSPLCRVKAESHGVRVPVYAGQRAVVEARFWRRTGWSAAALGLAVVAALVFWGWYEWFGSRPRVAFSVPFTEPAFSGQTVLCGKGQIVFLHGDTLARYDMKQKKEVWSRRLLDKQQIEAEVAKEIKRIQALIDQANNEGSEKVPKMPSRDKLTRNIERAAAAALELRVRGQNIWIVSPGKLARYDWETGNPAQEIAVKAGSGGVFAMGDELLVVDTGTGRPSVTHINLTTCDSRTEEIGGTNASPVMLAGKRADGQRPRARAGLPIGTPGKDAGEAMDPEKVAEQAQHMSYPARIALPAVLANNLSQERALSELDDQNRSKPASPPPRPAGADVSVIPAKEGFIELSVRLVESRMVARDAMKAPPTKSVLSGTLTISKTTDAANEILNEMQRSRGGDIVYEDQSIYRVTLRSPDGKDAWTGDVTGVPKLLPLETVNVLAADKKILVFDKANKLLWQKPLNFNVPGGPGASGEENAPYGQGPCVEHKGSLYIYDQGVLTAFDLKTGNARWRMPSVGITGLFFDDAGMIYVNTTTASPESIRYSRQIDISQKAVSVILKIDPASGKMLWSAEPGGLVNYVSGKFVYTVQSYMPDDTEDEDPYKMDTGYEERPYLRIKRINPKNGKEMWEHYEDRAPVDVEFEQNTIRLVFKKEVQVLRFLAF